MKKDNCALATTRTTTTAWEACDDEECRTEHGCYCLKTWTYRGKTYRVCPSEDEDETESSCWVADPEKCVGASPVLDADVRMKRDSCGKTTTTTTTLNSC